VGASGRAAPRWSTPAAIPEPGHLDPSPTHGVRTTALTALVTTLASMPVMLLGALAVLIREDLGFDRPALGLAIGVYFGTSSAAAVPAGRFVERVGAERGITTSATITLTCLVGAALLARSWGTLALFLFLGGLGNSLAHPSSNLALSRGVPLVSQGLAFGVKQSSIPLAGLLAGLTVPLIAVTMNWRLAFASGCVLVVPVAALLRATRIADGGGRPRPAPRDAGLPLVPLVVLALAFAFGSAAANSLGGFIVESAVAGGLDVGTAGLLFGINSAIGIVARITYGWWADRREARHLRLVALLLVVGAVGFVALSSGGHGPLLWIGSMLAFVGGWSWPGLFNFAVVWAFPRAPAAATGATLAGGYAGSTLAPIAFGIVVRQASFRVAWLAIATLSLIGATLMIVGRAMIMKRRPSVVRGAGVESPAAYDSGPVIS
jgi:MFS family permease